LTENIKEFISAGDEETQKFAEKFAKKLKGGDIVALSGGLGAGKTVFCKGLAQGLGIKDTVKSPTFTVLNLYKGMFNLYHYDVYRIINQNELFETGFYDNTADKNGITVIEWPQNIRSILEGFKHYKVTIERTDEDNKRFITISK